MTWTASPSADVDNYRVRSSAGSASLNVQVAPIQDSLDTSYQQTFTTETGPGLIVVIAAAVRATASAINDIFSPL